MWAGSVYLIINDRLTLSGATEMLRRYLKRKTGKAVYKQHTLNGSQIISEQRDDKLLVFLYDESGSPIGMQYRTDSMSEGTFYTYLFEKNLQGDIIAVYNTSGTKLISYVYDAWGNVTATNHNVSGTNSGAWHNPFRYRGYYYDTETGYYYLQSRYYNPKWGRFLNADSYLSTGTGLLGYNMYVYCCNNPVNMIDVSGNMPKWLTGTINAISGAAQMLAGGAVGAFAGWTGIGAVAGGVLIANGAATITQGVGQIVNSVTDSEVMREDNLIKATVQGVGETIGGETGSDIAGFAYDSVVAAASIYSARIPLQQSGKIPVKVEISKIFNNPRDPFTKGMPCPGKVSQYCREIPYKGYGRISAIKLSNGYYQLIDGHHRVAALKSLGYRVIKIYISSN